MVIPGEVPVVFPFGDGVVEVMNPRVVMAVGGWSSFGAIKPYLHAPTEKVVNRALDGVNL